MVHRQSRLYAGCFKIDLATWKEGTYVLHALAYDAVRDRLISYTTDEKNQERIGYFPHYTVEELRRKAEKATDGYSLTDEERTMYGLK